ncbi:hypothetical protein NPIL_288031 [Nephila pilipes]|uniref:Uncharacterized protein n=1 Tax=Nephila pilipes TaxID=299642 RepID=A0A8X6N2H6_NEPPI|nr:hypothetical protein NPIL_288031 [Nephila pilipes]
MLPLFLNLLMNFDNFHIFCMQKTDHSMGFPIGDIFNCVRHFKCARTNENTHECFRAGSVNNQQVLVLGTPAWNGDCSTTAAIIKNYDYFRNTPSIGIQVAVENNQP